MKTKLLILSALLAAVAGCKRESGDMTSEPAYPTARERSTHRGTNQAGAATNRTDQSKTNNPAKP